MPKSKKRPNNDGKHPHMSAQQKKRALFWELISRKQGLHIRF